MTQAFRIVRRCPSDTGIIQSRHSRRIVPITRSQMAFAFGLANGERSLSMPKALIESSKRLAKIRSLSWIKCLWPSLSLITSLNCCSVQSAVGFAVTFTCYSRRVQCSMTTNTSALNKQSELATQKKVLSLE